MMKHKGCLKELSHLTKMTSTKKTYKLSKIKQLIDLNGDSTNFDIQFRVASRNGEPFDILVVDQTTLDNSPELQYKKANGQMSGNMVQDKNVYQNYFIVLKADDPCECDVEIIKKELPKTRTQIPDGGVPPMGAPPSGVPDSGIPPMPSQNMPPRKGMGGIDQTNWKTWAIVGVLIVGGIILYMVWASDKKKAAAAATADVAAPVGSVKASPVNAASPVHSSYADSPSPVSASPAPSPGGYAGNSLMDRLKRLHMN